MTITGVIGINDKRVMWLLEDMFNSGIDIDYLSYIREKREELETEGVPEEEIEDTLELECEEYERGTVLIGYKLDPESGLYDEDPDAELSAILREDVVQITKSPVVVQCRECSPCYPNQGDLGSPVEYGFDTYAPRPEDGDEE